MKICISSTGENLDTMVDPRFGRAQFFIIFDTEKKDFKAVKNSGATYGHGAGIAAAQLAVSLKVKAVITGNVGPNAFMALKSTGIKVYPGVFDKSVKEAIDLLKNDKLNQAQEPTNRGHFGMGPGFGKGPPDSI